MCLAETVYGKVKLWNPGEESQEKDKTDPRRRIFKWWFVVGKFNEFTTDMCEFKLLEATTYRTLLS